MVRVDCGTWGFCGDVSSLNLNARSGIQPSINCLPTRTQIESTAFYAQIVISNDCILTIILFRVCGNL